jgi:hypothetical protein
MDLLSGLKQECFTTAEILHRRVRAAPRRSGKLTQPAVVERDDGAVFIERESMKM